METLSSLKNPRVQLWRSLKERKARKETGLFLVEGRKMVTEALASDFPVETILCDAAQAETYASLLSQGEAACCLLFLCGLAAVCDLPLQIIAAVVRMGRHCPSGTSSFLVALWMVNAGPGQCRIICAADCAGMERLYPERAMPCVTTGAPGHHGDISTCPWK